MKYIIEQDPIIKEAANPLSNALISLKSWRDPFKEEISKIREHIDDAIGSLDTGLHLVATGEEKQIRVVTENLNALKKSLRSVSWIISDGIARKIALAQHVNVPPVVSNEAPNNSSEQLAGLGVVNQMSSQKLNPNEKPKNQIELTVDELTNNFINLKRNYEELDYNCRLMWGKLNVSFDDIEDRHKFLIDESRRRNLTEVIEGMKSWIISTIKQIQKGFRGQSAVSIIDNVLAKGVDSYEWKEMNNLFIRLRSTYIDRNTEYQKVIMRYDSTYEEVYASKIKLDDDDDVIAPEKGVAVDPIVDPNNAGEPSDVALGSHAPEAIIVLSESYNRVLFEFMIKHASEPSVFEKIHTKVNEVGQSLKAPFSSVTKRRVRIRKALKAIKKSVINLLVEIRRTAGKKDSIEEEIGRWNSIIASYNFVGNVLNDQINSTLTSQFSLSNADLYNQKITEMKGMPDQRGDSQQRHMTAVMDEFTEPLPAMPNIEGLISLMAQGKPWGSKVQKKTF